jgi:hypothetical protein
MFGKILPGHLPAGEPAGKCTESDDLVRRGALKKIGTTGRGTHYVLADKQDKGTQHYEPHPNVTVILTYWKRAKMWTMGTCNVLTKKCLTKDSMDSWT